jgi:cytoskeletal protein RodZ
MSIGSMISQARISVGLTIDDLSDATNIRSSLLKEIESDDFSNCGGQTYFRGHLRKIASVLGVDPQIFLSAFEEEHVPSNRSMRDLLVENNVLRAPQESLSLSLKVLTGLSVGCLLVLVLIQTKNLI